MIVEAYYLIFVINVLICAGVLVSLMNKSKRNEIAEGKAKQRFSVITIGVGLLCGPVLFPVLSSLLSSVGIGTGAGGHGEIYIASIIFNLLISITLIIVGRIIIGWKPIKF